MKEIKDTISHICQNCGNDISGNYCSNCGQSVKAPFDRSVFSILGHFFEELFTWDSRIFLSVKYLFIKTRYLTHEVISERNKKYVSPVKMFLFTSFILFFIMIKSDPDQYRSIVTDEKEDNFMKEFVVQQELRSGLSKELYTSNFNDQFNNNITVYIFVIMLIFSVLLKIVYMVKHYFYSEHVVFTLHFFTFVIWCYLLGVLFQGFGEISVFVFWYFIPGIYLFFALKRVYHKTLWKAVIASGFLTLSFWILQTIWIFGTIFLSAVRAA